ncbi:TetR/AcrR family transcriptional regulator [Bradyrhizobium sp. B097]|uniref:TetR/AcrR family transcriptional regulator n=1 Tax=Bradyrhizobium sp. B097 TaxID=3140244 RepID=UPI00318385E6
MTFGDAQGRLQRKPQNPAGVMPAQQARSEATMRALMEAGRLAFNVRDYDQVTIEDIAAEAGSSVGSFYSRFESKEVFFDYVQETILAEELDILASLLDRLTNTGAGKAEFLSELSRFWVGVFRKHRGIYKTACRYTARGADQWTPFRKSGHTSAGMVANALAPQLAGRNKAARDQEVREALQVVNGLLVNAILNEPGPVSLDDQRMERSVVKILQAFLNFR